MKRLLSYTACIISLGIGSISSTTLAQTTAPGPYYATPSWDQKLPASTRFIVLSNWNNEAVLDRETGLVWEKSPPSAPKVTWFQASNRCITLNAGGRTGWRLPTIQDLLSLVDRSVPSPGPTLPSGHPFTNVQQDDYWSATTNLEFSSPNPAAWGVLFDGRGDGVGNDDKRFSHLVWCVRGGQAPDAQ